MTGGFEPWPEAYQRIVQEVRAEMPDATEQQQYREYRTRCAQWKREKGLKLSERDLQYLAEASL